MSASTTPTRRPCSASAAARLTVIEDLPTPPFPEATAYTRVRVSGRANGISFSGAPPRRLVRSVERCSSLITPSWTDTEVTSGTALRAAVTSRVMVSFIGQPGTVSRMVALTSPVSAASTASTIPSSVIGLRISGSLTLVRAACRASREGAGMSLS